MIPVRSWPHRVGREGKMGGIMKQVQFGAFGVPHEVTPRKVDRATAPMM